MTTSANRLTREKLLLRYTGALERGDAETVVMVLRYAEADPNLARMIDEINVVYAVEDSAIRPAVRQPSPNGHNTKELPVTTLALPTISRRTEKRRALPLTLVATLAAFLLIGSALFSAFNRRDQGTPAALQSTATVALTASPTSTPANPPLRYYMETLGEVFYNIGDQRQYLDYYSYTWFEAPNKYRSENYGNYNVDVAPLPYANRVTALSRTTAPDISQLKLNIQKPFQLLGITANNGDYAWSYGGNDPMPMWINPKPSVALNVSIGAQQIIVPTLDALVAAFQQRNYGDVKRVADANMLGRPVYVFAINPIRTFPYVPSEAVRVVIAVDQATLVQLGITAFDADDKEVYKIQAVKFVTETSIDPTLFNYALPAEMPVTVLPTSYDRFQRELLVSFAAKADFDIYGLFDDAVFTQDNLVPGEFYLDSFGRSSLQYYHAATNLFDMPTLAIWSGSYSTSNLDKYLPGQVEPTIFSKFIRKVELNGISATLAETQRFPLIHTTYAAGIRDTLDFYRLFWTVGDTVIVMTADKSKIAEQELLDLAAKLTYVPPMVSAKAMDAAWEAAVERNVYGPKVFKTTLFNDRVSDNLVAGGNYSADQTYIFQKDPESDRNARNAYYKLVPTLPELWWRDGEIVQRFYSSQHAGTALIITQGGDWIIPTDVSVASREEEFDYYGFKGIYRVETVNTMERGNPTSENIQTIITQIDGTTIVMQAPFDDQNLASLHKEEMLAILPTLKEVPPSTAK